MLSVFVVSGVRTSYKKKVGKKKNGHELYEARTHAIKSKIGHRDQLTILPKMRFLFFRGARQTRDTARVTHAQHNEREREAVMTDDGSQPPIEQLATAVHGSTPLSWCSPMLLVCAARRGCIVVGVLCILSDVWISAVSFGEEPQNIRNIIQLRY